MIDPITIGDIMAACEKFEIRIRNYEQAIIMIRGQAKLEHIENDPREPVQDLYRTVTNLRNNLNYIKETCVDFNTGNSGDNARLKVVQKLMEGINNGTRE